MLPSELLYWKTDKKRRGPISSKSGPTGETNIGIMDTSEVQGMIAGYGMGFSGEKEMLLGCLQHGDSPEDEATVHGNAQKTICGRSMTINARGNGICNGRLNVPAYGFDAGDCCLPELPCVSPYHALFFNISYFW